MVATRSLMNTAGQSGLAHKLDFLGSLGFCNESQSLSSSWLSGEIAKSLQKKRKTVGEGLSLQCEDERLNLQRDNGQTTYL